MPNRCATSATEWPRSVTCLTASILNSSVYRLPLILTSSVAVNYGSKMSTKGWPVHFGVDELTGLALLIIGWPFLPTRRKPKGATIGTSIASRVARRHLDFKIEKDILPTLTLGSVRRLKILWTRNIGVFVGRTVPIIGEVILAYDVSVISYRSAVHYNQLVKPEDRL